MLVCDRIPPKLTAGGGYIAAPSANASGRPSPTLASHVAEDLNNRIDMIIDGGEVGIGIESTIVDLSGEVPTILRPGYVTAEMLERVIGHVDTDPTLMKKTEGGRPKAPGMRYRHYAPVAVVTLIQGPEDRVVPLLQRLYAEQEAAGKKACVLCFSEHVDTLSACRPHDIGSASSPEEIAHRLFDVLRRLDEEGMETVFSEVVPPEGVGLAVMNRLGRAASFRTIQA